MKINILKTETVEKCQDEELNVPIDISDIINVCKAYNKLGLNIQFQVEHLLDLGVDEAVEHGIVKVESLPVIKDFLNSICDNPYFGDSCLQSVELIEKINDFIENNNLYSVQYN